MLYIILIGIPFLLFLLWQFQAMNEGREEGMFYSCKYLSKNQYLRAMDEHAFWTKQRIIIASGFISQYAAIGFYAVFNWISVLFLTSFLALAYILVFSFWHNGSLYSVRNRYNQPGSGMPYPGGWKAEPDGKAVFDFSYPVRKGMLIAGWLIFLLFVYLNLRICGRI